MEGTFPLPIISLEFVLQLEQTEKLFLLVFTQQCCITSPLGAVCRAEESLVGGSHQNLLPLSLKDTGLRASGQPDHMHKTDWIKLFSESGFSTAKSSIGQTATSVCMT